MADQPANPSTSAESSTAEGQPPPKKLTKAEKKLLYKKEFPEPMNTQRKVLKDIYIEEKDDVLKKELMASISYEIFAVSEDPYTSFLNLYELMHDCPQAKANSLAGTILRHFGDWLNKVADRRAVNEAFLTTAVKARALVIFTKYHTAHVPLATQVFEFDQGDIINDIRDQIRDLMGRLHFKDAMDMVTNFSLQKEYDIHQFCVPCILQDKLQSVKEYLKGYGDPDIIKSLFKFYDSFIFLSPEEVVRRMQPYKEKKIMTLDIARFQAKAVPDTMKGLFTYFNLDDKKDAVEYAPRYESNDRQKNLRFNVRRRFGDPSTPKIQPLSDVQYVSTIKGFMQRAKLDDKLYFLKFLWNSRQREDAVRWVFIFDINRWDIPEFILDHMESNPEEVNRIRQKCLEADEEEDITGLTMAEDYPIIIVATWEEVQEMIAHFPTEEVLGIDSEWKPQYLASFDEVALLQIAISKAVYLVDYISLEDKLNKEQWTAFFDALLLGDAIKLGFDFINDLRALFNNACTKEFKEWEARSKNALCVKRLMENILAIDGTFVDLSSEEERSKRPTMTKSDQSVVEGAEYAVHFTLARLCERTIGESLDKVEQCSDWAKRPLTKSQVVYAAKDAYILLQLYDHIKTKALDQEMDLDTLVQQSLANAPKKDKAKAKKAKGQKIDDMAWQDLVNRINEKTIGDVSNKTNATDFRCLVDLMLRGLGKHLRRLGADVWLPDTKEGVVKMAQKDRHRLIISSGKAVDQLRAQFPGRVMCVPNFSNQTPVDQLRYVATLNNLVLNKDDIFSRCMDCNQAGFAVAPAPVMQALHQCHVVCTGIYHDEPFDIENWKQKLSSVDPADYGGYGCELLVSREYPDWFTVLIDRGKIDITRNLVLQEKMGDQVPTQIQKVPDQVLQKPGRFFYICGGCGKIYWDGAHQENYLAAMSDILQETPSAEEEEKEESPSAEEETSDILEETTEEKETPVQNGLQATA